jgi:hypothetical protein
MVQARPLTTRPTPVVFMYVRVIYLVPRLTKQQAPLHGVMDRIMRIARRGPDEYLAAHDLLTNALASLDAAFNLKQLAGHGVSCALPAPSLAPCTCD